MLDSDIPFNKITLAVTLRVDSGLQGKKQRSVSWERSGSGKVEIIYNMEALLCVFQALFSALGGLGDRGSVSMGFTFSERDYTINQ